MSTSKKENKTFGQAVNCPEEEDVNEDPDMFCGVHRSILEAFDNLDWVDTMSPERRERFETNFIPPEEGVVSHAMKLINSEFVPFNNKEYDIPPMPANKGNIICYLPGLNPDYQLCLPKRSVLTRREQEQLYKFYCLITFKNRPLSDLELTQFQCLRAKVAGEYAEFQEYARTVWYTGQFKRTLEIPPQVEQYIDSLWKMRAGQCLSAYPDEYKSIQQIPLALNDPHADFCELELVKHVHSMGLTPKLTLPKVKHPIELISGFEELCRIKPVSSDFQSNPKPIIKPTSSVCFDPQVEEFLTREDLDIDVVISMSGIKTLIDNIKFQREWILPVTVKHVLKSDGETLKKVVLIGKKLPHKTMSVHEKNLWHARVVSKWMLLNEFPNLFSHKKETPLSKDKANRESYDDMLNEVAEKLKMRKSLGKEMEHLPENTYPKPPVNQEQLKTESSPVINDKAAGTKKLQTRTLQQNAPKRSSRTQGRQDLISYDDPFNDYTVEDIEEFGVDPAPRRNLATVGRRQGESECSNNLVKNSREDKIPEQPSTGHIRKKITFEEVGENSNTFIERPVIKLSATRRGLKKPCLQYHIWNLHKSKFVPFLKLEQRPLNILVRTKLDGKLFIHRNNIKSFEDVCVSSKLEFQPEFGASKMAASELIREYLDLYMRPNSKLVRVRSIGHTKELMMTEIKTLSEIRDALQVEIRQTKKLFDPLYAVLTKLIDLEPGRYMLQHLAKMGPFANLLVEKPGWTSFNLPHYCSELIKVEVSVPPMPIDPLVLTPLHHRDRTAPALYQPLSSFGKDKASLHAGKYFGKPPLQRKSDKKKRRRANKTSRKN